MMQELVGQELGKYRLIRLLGQGGFAEVYLGQHIYLKSEAAIKILHTRMTREQVLGFVQEAQVIARLIHPNIVRVLDFDVASNGVPFLVMDYCPYGTLRQRHANTSPLPLATVLSYVEQVAPALYYAHENKLIHRDIKPENMLIGPQNQILLSDFGIASSAHSTSSMSAQIPIGTIYYMAPEQIQAQARPASDQYALAVTVYQWLSGVLPFQGSPTEVIAQHLTLMPPSLVDQIAHFPKEGEKVIFQALAKDSKERFASVQNFATALHQSYIGELIDQPSSPPPDLRGSVGPKAALRMTPSLPPPILPLPPTTQQSMAEASRLQEVMPTMTPAAQNRPSTSSVRKLSPRAWLSILGLMVILASLIGGGMYVAGTQNMQHRAMVGPDSNGKRGEDWL